MTRSRPNRDYGKERKYDGKESVKKRRNARNRARYAMIKAGRASVGDGKDVSHSDNNVNNNSLSNLKSANRSKNRSFSRNTKAGRKSGKTPAAKPHKRISKKPQKKVNKKPRTKRRV
jgi:hypothetical protein